MIRFTPLLPTFDFDIPLWSWGVRLIVFHSVFKLLRSNLDVI